MARIGHRRGPAANGLELDLFGHIESVIYLDSQISNGTLQFRMAEKKLNGA
ncbi:MAG: hypothetical protein JWQ24_2091 [Tardiphaga sp.]|nr:hypothetical protein [Tardiphaga sp.]